MCGRSLRLTLACLRHPRPFKTFNVSSGSAISLQELLSLVGGLSGHHPAVTVNPKLVRKNDVRSLCGNSEKLRGVIGPLKQIPMEETLRWMLED